MPDDNDSSCPTCGHNLLLHDADGCDVTTCKCRQPYQPEEP